MKKSKQKIETIKNLKFTCPECTKHVIEEVMVNVSLYSNLLTLSEDGDFEHDLTDQSDGEVGRYQCFNCGYIIHSETGRTITDCLELVKWLKTRAKKRKK